MAQRRNRARPVRRSARLHADKAPRQSLEEAQNLNTAHRFTDHHSAARIDAMDLKNVLGQINSDRRNLVHGWLPPLVILDDTILALQMPPRGHPPQLACCLRRAAREAAFFRLGKSHLSSS
jgi:hypothetical protein